MNYLTGGVGMKQSSKCRVAVSGPIRNTYSNTQVVNREPCNQLQQQPQLKAHMFFMFILPRIVMVVERFKSFNRNDGVPRLNYRIQLKVTYGDEEQIQVL